MCVCVDILKDIDIDKDIDVDVDIDHDSKSQGIQACSGEYRKLPLGKI